MTHYEALNIPLQATYDDIKTAYRTAAKKYHPDRNPGNTETEKLFKQANEAYEVLSDPVKRSEYDASFREQPRQSDWFGGIFTNRRETEIGIGGEDISVDLEIDFEEAFKGCEKDISVNHRTPCKDCGGLGCSKFQECPDCKGSGKTVKRVQQFIITNVCGRCSGRGKLATESCKQCSGTGYHVVEDIVSVVVPSGISEGVGLRVRGEGHKAISKGSDGDLLIDISIKSHDLFKRNGIDLIGIVDVTYTDLVFGTHRMIDIFGKQVDFDIPAATNPNKSIRLWGLGFSDPADIETKGDLLVKLRLSVPDAKTLSSDYLDLLAKLKELEFNTH